MSFSPFGRNGVATIGHSCWFNWSEARHRTLSRPLVPSEQELKLRTGERSVFPKETLEPTRMANCCYAISPYVLRRCFEETPGEKSYYKSIKRAYDKGCP